MAWAGALALPAPASAGAADVVAARILCEEGVCLVEAAVRHDDEGFHHYADRFEVLAPDGRVLATRVLAHPHVDEQPFTRRLPGVVVPPDVTRVRVRAHDSVHGLGGRELELPVPRDGEASAP